MEGGIELIKFWGADRPNGFLSNFYFSDFTMNDVVYPTVEHYFQSKKFEGTKWEDYILSLPTPKDTAREGKRRDLPLRKDWESIKEQVMYEALHAKFSQSKNLRELLLNTHKLKLVENSPFDSYWGIGKNQLGMNRLGVLLMRLRDEI